MTSNELVGHLRKLLRERNERIKELEAKIQSGIVAEGKLQYRDGYIDGYLADIQHEELSLTEAIRSYEGRKR